MKQAYETPRLTVSLYESTQTIADNTLSGRGNWNMEGQEGEEDYED